MNKYLIYTFCFSVTAMLHSCSNSTEPEAGTEAANVSSDVIVTSAQKSQMGLVSQPVVRQTVGTAIVANGMLDVPTQYMASVSTFMGSFVKSADKHVGEKVTKGQVLAVMEGPEFVDLQQQYLEQRSRVGLLKAEFERQTNLAADSIASQKNLQKITAEYEQAAAIAEGLKQKLAFAHVNFEALHQGKMARSYVVVSPISGFLTDVPAMVGSYVSPGEPLMEIVDLSHLHVELSVYESDAMAVKEGQRIEITIPSDPGKTYEADVYLIDKEFDPATRSVKVHGHFEQMNNPFIVGMYVEGKIFTGEQTGWAAPSSAAVFYDNDRFIILEKTTAEGSRYFPVDVTDMKESDGWFVLPEAPIADGYTSVVTKGAGYLLAAWSMEE